MINWSLEPPPSLPSWKTHPGSMTRSLKCMAKTGITINRLQECSAPANDLVINCFLPSTPLILREAIINLDESPIIYAQTWLTQTAFDDTETGLKAVGDAPIGELLFSRDDTRRDPITYATLQSGDLLYDKLLETLSSLENTLVARRSVIHYCGHPLCLIEVFLK
jgi:chorismate lyase